MMNMVELSTRTVTPGEVIFRAGDPADCAYIITAGHVEIQVGGDVKDSQAESGTPHCIAVVGPGQLLGEMAIIDNAPRSATAVAREAGLLTVFDRRQLVARLEAADPILRLLLTVLLNRLRGQLRSNQGRVIEATVAPDMVIDRIRLENQLKVGLGAGEMRLFLQPITDIKTRRVAGFEALIRWQHPERGMVRPDLFIKVAEESGLIVPLGVWVLREACRAALRVETEPNQADVMGRSAFVSVNVSPGQFHDAGFIAILAAILRETGIDPQRLKLEITESALANPEAARAWIDACKQLGVRIALDDFGTGYSSLSYLHEFKIDTLKIDQSFVRRMLQDSRSECVVAAIIRLGHELGMDIIAEGIETESHFSRLAQLGCDYAQGYLLAKPAAIGSYFTEPTSS
ncbi:MAG: EAL domain-containing protein [Candidatus Competibacteraceae bacterium]|nr:MAG: EAL domain-containing protein [Candidatus Competibacteraceae bacterium]